MKPQHPYRKAITLGGGFLGIMAIWPIFNTFVPLFLAQLGLSATLVGFIMTWDNYFNMFLQPAVGAWSDQSRTKIGRRKPWLLAGAPLAAIFFIAIPASRSVGGIMIAILLTNIGMALFRSPTVALMGDIFPPKERSTANGIINLMGGIGAIIAFVGSGFLYALGRIVPFLLGSLVLLGGVAIVLLWVREPGAIPTNYNEERAGYPSRLQLRQLFTSPHRSTLIVLLVLLCYTLGIDSVQTWLSSFDKFELGLDPGRISTLLGYAFVLPSILFALPAGLLGTRFGRRQTMLAGLVAMAAAVGCGWLVQNELMLGGLLVVAGVSSALVIINALPLLYDVGGAHIGALTGLYYFTLNFAAIIGPPLVGLLIDLGGKNYRVMFLPTAFFIAVAAILLGRMKQMDAGCPRAV